MTRIVAGVARGRTLRVPRSGTRPTSDRVREAIFSRLEHDSAVHDSVVLDLYCGSGALALEALSRGARQAVLVDSASAAVACARENVRELGLPAEVVRMDALKYVTSRAHPSVLFDLVLCDPPYELDTTIMNGLLVEVDHIIGPQSTVVVERSVRSAAPSWPDRWVMTARPYGDTMVFIGGPAAQPDELGSPSELP